MIDSTPDGILFALQEINTAVLQLEIKYDEKIKLLKEQVLTEAKNALSESVVLEMTVMRLGGIVEGHPTARLNFLQRIDELRLIEKENEALKHKIGQHEEAHGR